MKIYHEPYYVRMREKMGSQTVEMDFDGFRKSIYEGMIWYVCLTVYNKRKQIDNLHDSLEVVGKRGAETFVIALKMLKEFEKYLQERTIGSDKNSIYIGWADSLRKKIYCHFLKRYGYRYIHCPKENGYMVKDITVI
jgi:hypothetical protein